NAVKVDLPQVGGVAELAPRPVIIALDRDNVITFETRPVTLDEAVATAFAHWRDEARPVIISADRKADVGDALKLLSELKNAGVTAVSFQVSENAQ
ncbi:MAG: biopolymer transporter ExbD, partial [Kiritimatiellaeota bacterium]|nr:biopolymer transporter ExbD [Kiritimatiellota bacterium]